MTDDHAQSLLSSVIDRGINLIDTAYDYVNSEVLIGRILSHHSSEFYLATKCGCTDTLPESNWSSHIWTRDNLFRGLEGSLERLGTDHIDLIQLHNPSFEECERGKLVDALEEMRRQGLVRWIGVSTTLPDLPRFLQLGAFDVFQIPYSALERDHEGWISRAAEAGVGIIIRGCVARGEPGVGLDRGDRWQKFRSAGLDELLEEGQSPSAFVLRFTLTHPHVHSIIVGTTNLDHLRENAQAVLKGPLPADVYSEAKRRLDSVGERPADVE